FLLTSIFLIIFQQLLYAYTETEIKTITFAREKLKIEKIDSYNLVKYVDYNHSMIVGAPQLPVQIIRLPLLPGQEIIDVKVLNVLREEIKGEYEVYPVQPPQVLSDKTSKFTAPNSKVYNSNESYPANIVEIGHDGYITGYNVGALLVYPVQYIPQKKQLIFNSQIEIEITYRESKKTRQIITEENVLEPLKRKTLKTLLGELASGLQSSIENNKSISELPEEEHAYVIITSEELESSFQPLADWKRKKGFSATIVTTSWIAGEYTGIDLQEQIRNFIIDAYQTWETEWVLLGGDTEIIPDRKAFAMDCEYGDYTDNYIPCDLYYADLDGNWNANGNDIYGETDDEVDLYPDVFVGRASVEDAAEAEAFVNKILTYEKYDEADNALNMLFLAGVLWNDPFTDSGEMKNYIDEEFVPARFDPITKLYTSLNNDDMTSVLEALNTGQNIINHCNHAWHSGVSTGGGFLGLSEADGLTNG
ncbi:MAG: hypothetical protein KAR38_17760, partial [Calditrichia bacterium]|nr:hypothetical protein [Calditrichia bacterium]